LYFPFKDEQLTELVDAEFHGRNEYMDKIDELKKEISFLKVDFKGLNVGQSVHLLVDDTSDELPLLKIVVFY